MTSKLKVIGGGLGTLLVAIPVGMTLSCGAKQDSKYDELEKRITELEKQEKDNQAWRLALINTLNELINIMNIKGQEWESKIAEFSKFIKEVREGLPKDFDFIYEQILEVYKELVGKIK